MAVERARPWENPKALLAGMNAVYDAVGVRIKDLPITPDKVLKALREKEKLAYVALLAILLINYGWALPRKSGRYEFSYHF